MRGCCSFTVGPMASTRAGEHIPAKQSETRAVRDQSTGEQETFTIGYSPFYIQHLGPAGTLLQRVSQECLLAEDRG